MTMQKTPAASLLAVLETDFSVLGRRGKKGRKKEWVKGKKADYGCVLNRELIGFGSRPNIESMGKE